MRNAVGTWAIGQCLATFLSSPKLLLNNTVLCKSNANTCRRNSKKFQFFDEFLTKTKLSRHFCEFSRDVLFWTARTLATCSLMALMRLEISSENSFYVANISGENSLVLFILSKGFGWICGSVLLYVKLRWNFPLRFESPRDLCCLQPWQHSVCQLCQCVWDHLRTLLLVVIVAKVSNYSAKKKNQDPPQARPPPSWNPESVETRRATSELFQYYVHH